MNLRVAGIYGGTNINTQKKVVYAGLDILVATPGRLMDLYMTGLLRFKSIQKLVIDEVDEMLNQGFRPQLISLMEVLPERRQNLMFSATLTEDVEMLINDFFYEPKKVEITPHGTPLERIDQQAYHVPNYQTKVNLLELLLKENEDLSKVLVFVDNRKLADKLYDQIASKFPDQFGVIHSNKSQNLRLNSLKRFGDGTHRVLIATDIAARGLDISDVSHVINFDMPKAPGDYIHRIGRTGRADKDGVAITFINQIEQEYQMEIEQMMNKVMSLQESPGNLEISDKFEPSERPVLYDKDYLNVTRKTSSQGEAFHEKKDKNKKVNLGGPGRRKPKVGSKANRKRGRKK